MPSRFHVSRTSAARLACAALTAALAGVALAGCKLIDQRTFERSGSAPSAAGVARSAALASEVAAARAARPLVTVRPGNLDYDWQPDVLAAVRNALVRNPDAAFDIVAPFPSSAPETVQKQAIATGSADSAAVASVIQADGVPAEKLRLSARGDPGQPGRTVLVLLQLPPPTATTPAPGPNPASH